jgi:hypothetical protein
MATATVELIRIRIERSADGLYCATSPDLTGICLTHRNIAAIYDDMPNVIRLWYKSNRGADVEVMQAPLPAENDGFDWKSVAIPAEIAAMHVSQ